MLQLLTKRNGDGLAEISSLDLARIKNILDESSLDYWPINNLPFHIKL